MDGIALKIGCPQLEQDGVANPGDYFCWKGFHALNMQAILDPHKRFLWLSSGHIGSCPDSRAFPETSMYHLLLANIDFLTENGIFMLVNLDTFFDLFLWHHLRKQRARQPTKTTSTITFQTAALCLSVHLESSSWDGGYSRSLWTLHWSACKSSSMPVLTCTTWLWL
jgi:hypothetical protein